jgi:hypothetical protein
VSRVTTEQDRWNAAYGEGDRTRSWYQAEARVSLELIQVAGGVDRSVVDVGGGASVLVDELLAAGYRDVTVVDISAIGLDLARSRLGPSADEVTWSVTDLLTWSPARTFDVWHDRAVLHFLTRAGEVERYREVLLSATHPGSEVVIGTFGLSGPEQCSGLPVQRYNSDGLAGALGIGFELLQSFTQVHTTPAGGQQAFQWVRFLRSA